MGLDGLWRGDGYSTVIEFRDGRFRTYEISAVSCLNITPDWVDPATTFFDFWLSDPGKLIMRPRVAASYYSASKISEMPVLCAEGGSCWTQDPGVNFEVFWHTFNENCAFFDLFDVDWRAQYEAFRPQVMADTTDDELYEILSQMIAPLHDRHTSLTGPSDRRYSPGVYPAWLDLDQMAARAEIIQEKVERGVPPSGEFAWIAFSEFLAVIRDTYLHGELSDEYHKLIFYGKLSASVGYVNILRIMNYDHNPFEDVSLLEGAIDRVLEALQDVDTLIVDIRFNLGGWDRNSLVIASRFADRKRLVLSKHAREGNGFSPLREVYVEPVGVRQFTKKVILLTSGYTCSGAEIFTMAMSAWPHVTVVGERTAGCHSDSFSRPGPLR
jgi:carboxyl-terminal processing protease